MRRMDRVYWNILKLGDFAEETSTENCDTTPQDYQKERKCKNLLPPPINEMENKVDIVGRLFGGTVKTRKMNNLTLDDRVMVEKTNKKEVKSMKTFPRLKKYSRGSIYANEKFYHPRKQN